MFSMLQSKIFRAILEFWFSFIRSNFNISSNLKKNFFIRNFFCIAVTRQPLNFFMLFLYADRT